MKRIGLIGGTFDPPHFGHVNLAFELKEKHNLDEIWFVPVQQNPHKLTGPIASMDHRLKMLELTIEGIAEFKISDIEKYLPVPSYTLHTLQAIQEKDQSNQFFLLLGEDAIQGFYRWHEPEKVIKLAPLLIGSRSGFLIDEILKNVPLGIKKAIQDGVTKTRLLDISSTDLRERISKNLYCYHLLSTKVINYIYQNHLYQLK